MANLREEIVDTVATTLWRLEPVINLGNGHDIEGWELLTRPHFDSHEDWLRVYALMPKVIDGMRQCHGIRQPLSINLDTRQILDSEILRQVEQFSDRDIRVEWTEYSGVDEHEKKRAGQELVRLRQIYGVEIWIDDAGNGEDAIGRMSLTQPDAIKIGSSHECVHGFGQRQVCHAMVEIADVVLRGSKAVRPVADHLGLVVQPLDRAVVDRNFKVVHEAILMAAQHPGELAHRR